MCHIVKSDINIFLPNEPFSRFFIHFSRYGNVDIEVYDVSNFKSLIQNNVIWALEAIYCPTKFIIYEAFDFRKYYESECINYRKLLESVGYECGRKLSSSKRYFSFSLKKSKTHYFIALRFANYAAQICQFNCIQNIQELKHI